VPKREQGRSVSQIFAPREVQCPPMPNAKTMPTRLLSMPDARVPVAIANEGGVHGEPERWSLQSKADERTKVVERVIAAMRLTTDAPLSLCSMADIACVSPFHFTRIFRQVTGVRPRRFYAALRFERAKNLLLETDLSVTQICYDVGYNSLGTFIRHFTGAVGRSPRALRRMREETGPWAGPRIMTGGRGQVPSSTGRVWEHGSLCGSVRGPEPEGNIFVGLFHSAIPEGLPIACAVVRGNGEFALQSVPEGRYFMFAGMATNRRHPLDMLVWTDAWRAGSGLLEVGAGKATPRVELVLRRPLLTDPPILVVLPALIALTGGMGLHGPEEGRTSWAK